MYTSRKKTRKYLEGAGKTNFWKIVDEVILTEEEKKVLEMKFLDGKSIVRISIEMHMTVETVNRIISKAYDRIYNIVFGEVS